MSKYCFTPYSPNYAEDRSPGKWNFYFNEPNDLLKREYARPDYLGQFKDDLSFTDINFKSSKQEIVRSKTGEILGYVINLELYKE